ncbi:MAG: MBOAT family protein [Bacteroidetes bacterium]|nr:MBOAT family protein [Bacteroidota bacterium]
MLFNSLIFTLFLPIVFISYWVLPFKYRNYFLLLASYFFYYSYNPWFLLLLIGTSSFDYFCAKKIASSNYKKTFLWLSLISNLGVLFIFKYFVFFYNTGINLFSSQHHLLQNFIIPAGLSFYTFQSISYTIDVYRKKYEPNDSLFEFLLYVSFFPHMVAGPVVRYNSLMPQFKITSYFKNINWAEFAQFTIWGYFKKMVVADNIAYIVDTAFLNISNYSAIELLFVGFLFVIQLYCDLSGYSDIATGISKLFNINLSLNFQRPLLSKSLYEFWQRYHISVTSWFRDYLYVSLGGNRKGNARRLLNVFLVFTLSGFWHGANFTFVLWGVSHGVIYVTELFFIKRFIKIMPFMKWLCLMIILALTFVLFRASNIYEAGLIYAKLFSKSETYFSFKTILERHDKILITAVVFVTLLLFLKELNEEFSLINKHKKFYLFFKPIFFILIIILIFMIGNFNANTFIYFQF